MQRGRLHRRVGELNTFNTKPCSDALFCTENETCSGGNCVGTPRDCQAAGDQCNDGVCDEDLNACVPQALPDGTNCNDGTVCTSPDGCQGGVCTGPVQTGCCSSAADCDDGNPCTVDSCEESTGSCQHDAAALEGQTCEDGAFCTVGETCQGGSCVGGPRDCSLFDDVCTVGVCDEAADACVADPANEGGACPDDGKVCTDDVCQGGACTHPNNTVACDDQKSCTHTDTCNSGACIGIAYDCDDGHDCTADSCDGLGGCDNVVQAGTCLIEGQCRTDGESNAACKVCDPDESQVNWSVAPDGAACEDGDGCTVGDECQDGVCQSGDNECGQCTGLAAGSPCDDGDGNTVGDFCLLGGCAGFTVNEVVPTGAGANPFLSEVVYTGDGFYATGGDQKNGGRAWVASLTADSATIIDATVVQDDVYVDITDRLAVTEGTRLMQWSVADGWQLSGLTNELEKAGFQFVQAAWGIAGGSGAHWWLTGRQSNTPWSVHCTTTACASNTVDFQYWNGERPMALGGFGSLASPSAIQLYLAGDYKYWGTWYRDVFRRTGIDDAVAWTNDYYDGQSAGDRSRDVKGTASDNMWQVGTGGLLRVRQNTGAGAWTNLAPLGDSQNGLTSNGVWADASVVLVAGQSTSFTSVAVRLLTHDVTTSHTNADHWNLLELATLDGVGGTDGEKFQSGGQVGDVWANGGTVVVVGWVWDADEDEKRALILWRNSEVAVSPIGP